MTTTKDETGPYMVWCEEQGRPAPVTKSGKLIGPHCPGPHVERRAAAQAAVDDRTEAWLAVVGRCKEFGLKLFDERPKIGLQIVLDFIAGLAERAQPSKRVDGWVCGSENANFHERKDECSTPNPRPVQFVDEPEGPTTFVTFCEYSNAVASRGHLEHACPGPHASRPEPAPLGPTCTNKCDHASGVHRVKPEPTRAEKPWPEREVHDSDFALPPLEPPTPPGVKLTREQAVYALNAIRANVGSVYEAQVGKYNPPAGDVHSWLKAVLAAAEVEG